MFIHFNYNIYKNATLTVVCHSERFCPGTIKS